MPKLPVSALLCALCAFCGEPAFGQEPPPTPDPTRQMTTEVTVVPPVVIPPSTWKPGQPIKTADDLLSALENADANFKSLQAGLRKTKIFSELEGGGSLVWDGRMMFISEAPSAEAPKNAKPRRMFQVDFTSTTADNVKRPEQRTFVFDGQWFVEKQPEAKQVRKRQIVPPGQTVDPLAIGEGPFPIPIGQKRERILERFTAELKAPTDFPDGKQAAEFVADTYQLRLIPRGTAPESQQYREVRIWYRKSDLLPRMARTVERDDAANVVLLTDIKLNQPLPKGAFDTSVPKGWDAQIDEWRPKGDENAAVPTGQPPKDR